jgi:hypothetical protein
MAIFITGLVTGAACAIIGVVVACCIKEYDRVVWSQRK